MKKRFLVLRFIALALRVLGALTLIVALVGGIVALINGFSRGPGMMYPSWGNQMMGYWGGFGFLLSGLFGGILLYGAGEVIDLLLAIEENTRAMVTHQQEAHARHEMHEHHDTTDMPPSEQ